MGAIYFLNMIDNFFMIQKFLVLTMFLCFYFLTQELIFFEEFLSISSDSEKSLLEEVYMRRERAQVFE